MMFGDAAFTRVVCLPFPPPCTALQRSSHVLVADAIEVTGGSERVSETAARLAPQRVRFRVVESLKGVAADTRELQVQTDAHHVEATRFVAGSRYLIYASTLPDGMWSTACSRTRYVDLKSTRQVAWLEEELSELRRCSARQFED